MNVLPDLASPLLLGAVVHATFSRGAGAPGFPGNGSFLDFLVAGIVVVGVVFSSADAGDDLAMEIEGGFFDRLLTTPVARSAVLGGRLGAVVVYAGLEVVVFLAVLVTFGASVKGGMAAVAVIVVASMVLAAGVGALNAALALRTASAEAVAGYLPLTFLFVFVSSAFFPRQLMDGWFKTAAGANPLSWFIEDLRHQVIVGFDPGRAAQAVAIGLALFAVSAGFGCLGLRRRAAA